MLHIIFIILIGFVVGLIARFFAPDPHIAGFWMTVLVGVVGSVLDAVIGHRVAEAAVHRFVQEIALRLRDDARCTA